jgi:hypothetical protein
MPRGTSRSRPSTAVISPKRLAAPRIEIAGDSAPVAGLSRPVEVTPLVKRSAPGSRVLAVTRIGPRPAPKLSAPRRGRYFFLPFFRFFLGFFTTTRWCICTGCQVQKRR